MIIGSEVTDRTYFVWESFWIAHGISNTFDGFEFNTAPLFCEYREFSGLVD